MNRSITLFAIFACLGLGTIPCDAQRRDRTPPPAPPAEAAAPTQETKPAEEKPKDDIDAKVKGFDKLEGPVVLWRKVEEGKDTIYAEVRKNQLGEFFILQATAARGTAGTPGRLFQGAPLADIVFKLEELPNGRIALVEPVLGVRAEPGTPMERVVRRSFPESILTSFKIETRQPDRDSLLIDLSAFLKSDIAQVGDNLPQGTYGIEANETYVDNLKVFPENIVVRSVLGFRKRSQQAAGPPSVPIHVAYNLMSLPKTDYRPRIADSRVGYFTTDFDDPTDNRKRDQNVSYILRWDLRKKDPRAAVSEPVKPIVFWMSNDIPVEYRDAVREGLLMYNRAFEAAGFKNAIKVEQMPDDADWEIADVRYNIIRWTSGLPFAIALFRANPITGEILNAAINMDAVFVSGGVRTYDIVVDPTTQCQESPFGHRHLCNYAQAGVEHFRFGQVATEMLLDDSISREKLAHQYVREVVAHEMGHILGLRHNFIASGALTADELANPKVTAEKGMTSTVMEYTPFNIFALRTGGEFYASTVGSYDVWAIKYGYTPIDAASPEAELPTLRFWAAESAKSGHRFETDQMANAYDPTIATFDLAANPLDWCEKVLTVARFLTFELGKSYPKQGESYWQFTDRFNSLTSQYLSAGMHATRFVGGVQVHNHFHDGAAPKPIAPIPAAQQLRALKLIEDYIFSENAFAFPKSYFTMLAPNPNVPGQVPSASSREFPLFDRFAGSQSGVLNALFAAGAQRRIVNNEFRARSAEETFTLARLYRRVGASIWSELESGREISALRRQLQRDHLSLMIDTALGRNGGVPDDGKTLAWEQLDRLARQIDAALPSVTGEYDAAHLRESALRIRRAFEATEVLGSPPAGAAPAGGRRG